MSAPWQAMPDFVDGTLADEGDFDPMVNNISMLRQTNRVLAGRLVATAGTILTTSGTTEANISYLSIPSVTLLSGAFYTFNVWVYGSYSGASNEFSWLFRQATALTGALMISTTQLTVAAAFDDTKHMQVPWKCTSTITTSVFVSIQRWAGAGVAAIQGGQTAFWIEQMGDDTSSVWALT